MQNPKQTNTTVPLPYWRLAQHLEDRIRERGNISINWQVTSEEDGFQASMTDRAPASILRAVLEALDEAGWKVVTK